MFGSEASLLGMPRNCEMLRNLDMCARIILTCCGVIIVTVTIILYTSILAILFAIVT